MANTKQVKLFAEFPAVTTEKWESVITADLKGADYERKLVWKTDEGLSVRPYYRAENLEGIDFLDSQAGEFPYVRGTRSHNRWSVHQSIKVESATEANNEALTILNAGIDSLGFCICSEEFSAADLDTLLKGIDIPSVSITFCGEKIAKVADMVIEKVTKEGIEKKAVHINFCIDPLIKSLSKTGEFCCGDGSKCFSEIANLMTKAAEFKHIRVVNVTGQIFGNAGSTIVEELAFSLSAGHDYLVRLTEAGLDIDTVARKIRFSTSISANYFMEIAKIRAARMLWANIVKGYNPSKNCPCKMNIHAVTSNWNTTVYDPYVNMLRGTTEAMAASIAGVNSLEVTPFDASFQEPTSFSKRIARNVELLLKHESHFDQVVDAAGGSYYIENLTQSIAEAAWKLFLEIEEKGGYTKAYMEGFVAGRVNASAAIKDKKIATRRQILLGANQYPNFTEVVGAEVPTATVTRNVSEGNVIRPYRGAMAFEELRMQVDRSEKNPVAFMLTCGNLGMARARSQFACNFFACSGIQVQDNTYFKSIEEGVKAALEAKAEIVVVCAGDDDYAEVAPKIKEMLAGKAILVIAGAPACAPELEAQGISNFINVKSNVLETLKFYTKEMAI